VPKKESERFLGKREVKKREVTSVKNLVFGASPFQPNDNLPNR